MRQPEYKQKYVYSAVTCEVHGNRLKFYPSVVSEVQGTDQYLCYLVRQKTGEELTTSVTAGKPMHVVLGKYRARVKLSDATVRFLPEDEATALFQLFEQDLLDEERSDLVRKLYDWASRFGFHMMINDLNGMVYADDALATLLFPLYRELKQSHTRWFDLTRGNEIAPSALFYTFRSFVKKLTGYDSPKMLKTVGKRIATPLRRPIAALSNGTLTINVNDQSIPMTAISSNSIQVNTYGTVITGHNRAWFDVVTLNILSLFGKLLDVNKLYSMLDGTWSDNSVSLLCDNLNVRSFLKGLSKTKLERAARSVKDVSYSFEYLRDSANMLAEMGSSDVDEDWKQVYELHDAVIKAYNAWKEEKDKRPIVYKKWVAALDGMVLRPSLRTIVSADEAYTVRLAKDTAELVRWGKLMNNCIGSYGDTAVNDHSILGALIAHEGTPSETVFANFELSYTNKTITVDPINDSAEFLPESTSPTEANVVSVKCLHVKQLRGPRNASVSDAVLYEFQDLLRTVRGPYWTSTPFSFEEAS